MYNFVLFHGWASDTRIWLKVSRMLKALGYTVTLINRGYVGDMTEIPNLNGSIVVAHSLGVMHAYAHLGATQQIPKAFFSIGGFTRFSHTENFCGIKVRLLTSMKNSLKQDMHTCLQAFRKKANCEENFSGAVWNKKALVEGLDQLIHMDVRLLHREFSEKACFPLFALWGAKDKIVSRALTMACFSTVEVLDNCGHFVPVEDPQQCVHFIQKNVL